MILAPNPPSSLRAPSWGRGNLAPNYQRNTKHQIGDWIATGLKRGPRDDASGDRRLKYVRAKVLP